MKDNYLKNMGQAAMFIAIGLVLPFFTGQIPRIGNTLLPMHLPVFICGLLCGWKYGMGVGFVLPLLRSAVFGMPPLYPNAIAMAFELAAYGLVAGLLYGLSEKKDIKRLYLSLIIAMLAGRIVWGVAEVILLKAAGNLFTWQMFMAGAFFNAIPGLILQLTLIPVIVTRIQAARAD